MQLFFIAKINFAQNSLLIIKRIRTILVYFKINILTINFIIDFINYLKTNTIKSGPNLL